MPTAPSHRALLLALALTLGLAAPVERARAQQPVADSRPTADGTPVLRPGDLLRIRLWPDQAYSGDYPVESTGNTYLPLLGEVRAAGKTVGEVRDELQQRYRALVQNATVALAVGFRVTVLGSVARPGLYLADPTNTVVDAIGLAGGFAPNADIEGIQLVRGNRVLALSGGESLAGGAQTLTLRLQSGDRVVVPQRAERRITLSVVATILQLISTAILLTRVR